MPVSVRMSNSRIPYPEIDGRGMGYYPRVLCMLALDMLVPIPTLCSSAIYQ